MHVLWTKHNILAFHIMPSFFMFPLAHFSPMPLFKILVTVFSFNENSYRAGLLSISEINISKSYISLTPLPKQILCVMITLIQGTGLGRRWFLPEIRRQSSVSAHPFNPGCSICCISSSQATIVSLLKWNTLLLFIRHDYIVARSRINYLQFFIILCLF